MDVTMAVAVVKDIGFPIFVAGYLLIYQKRETEKNREVLLELKSVIQEMSKTLKINK